MPTTNKLTNVAVKNAKAALGRQRMLSDGNRLYLRARNRTGSIVKDWVFIYTPRTGAAQRKLGLGSYPTVTVRQEGRPGRLIIMPRAS